MRFRLLLLVPLLTSCAAPQTDRPLPDVPPITDALPPMKTFGAVNPVPAQRSNAEMARDFLDLSFAMENGDQLAVMSRFEGPITVAIRGPAPATASADLDRVLARMRREARLPISRTTGAASVSIEFVPVARMRGIAPTAACFVVPGVRTFDEYAANLRSPDLDWTRLTTRTNAAIFIPSDEAPQEVRDCLNEELAQAIGPLNDLYRLPDSVFNDDNFHGILTGFDMLMLRTYYAPELRSGMTRAQAAEVVPTLLRRFNPKGAFSAPQIPPDTPRAWIRAIETAFGPDGSTARRHSAAQRALAIAQKQGWTDNRLGFSWFALARLSLDRDVPTALSGFIEAARAFRALPDKGVHTAHEDMQMAAFALASGQAEAAILLTDVALPAARQSENAGLMATLLMMRSEALRLLDQPAASRDARREALGWARFGFTDDADVRQRMGDIQALSPDRVSP
ncbi:DUF2927 domain-containing protein [Falsirhodobacter halotolerans]|uniref:DUF2927 domain-containing protein n=1 Tax=Falsirhodobacter halotolerans TaxID=1146892 RepID=UPI001FCFE402|nr:DUF2927 domain-containing protein [Falsirhodobacter halotolerans]MCJ8139237.1 DUF2927 domain-containing protein [Falsirhodobacter halotolerans]